MILEQLRVFMGFGSLESLFLFCCCLWKERIFCTEAHGFDRVPYKPLSLVTWMPGDHPPRPQPQVKKHMTTTLGFFLPTSEPGRQKGTAVQTHAHILRPYSRKKKIQKNPLLVRITISSLTSLYSGQSAKLKGKCGRIEGGGRLARKQVPLCPG